MQYLKQNFRPMIFLVALLLSLWFWRRNLKDAGIWMLATYAGMAALLWTDFASASAVSDAVPHIVRDFLLLGMVGFVQSLAVAKRMPIWLAVLLTLAMFTLAYLLDEEKIGQTLPQTTTEVSMDAQPDRYGEFLVELKEGYSADDFAPSATANGWTYRQAFTPAAAATTHLDNYLVVDVQDDAVARAETILAGISTVEYFEPNEVIQVEPLISGDAESLKRNPSLSINDPETDQQWVMDVMNMEAYFSLLNTQTPVKKAKIAILDTGVDGNHEDLSGNYFSVDAKYDNDPMGHGTHCAGIAAGVTNNGIGIASLAGAGKQPFVEITSIKVLSAGGMGTQKTIIAGIIEAADEGADIISLSLGGPSNSSRQKAYSQAVKYAHDQGAIVVSAAGNSNRDAKDYAPANSDGMITVSAIDQNLVRAVFTNTVNNVKQGIAAPGVAIFSTTPDNNYKVFSGTSMACPFVAGLLGVMRSVNPDLTAKQAYQILNKTGKDVADSKTIGRVVQPEAALRAALR